MVIDLSTRSLIAVIRIKRNRKQKEVNDVYVKKPIIVDERTEMVCLLQTDMSHKGPMLFEPNELMKRKYNRQDSVVAIKNGYVPIRLVNSDVKSKQLLPETRMGKIYPLQIQKC